MSINIQKIADFILSLQDANGMILDAPGAAACNVAAIWNTP
jgi:hypothetical protein